jgi:hypothetical protein
MPGSDECDRQWRQSGSRTMAEQPGGKFTLAVSKAGRGDVEIPERKNLQKFAAVQASTILISTAISTAAPSSSRTAPTRWPSGVNWRHEPIVF